MEVTKKKGDGQKERHQKKANQRLGVKDDL